MIGKKLSELVADGKTSVNPDYLYGEEAGVSVAVIGPKKSVVTPPAGTTITMAPNQRYLVLTTSPSGTLTIVLPPSPKDGQLVSIGFGVGFSTTVTFNGGTVVGVAATPGPSNGFTLIYDLATTTWYRTG